MSRHFADIQLGSVELFCLTVVHGSFTAAAQQAGVTPAAVSRSVSRLEARMGVRLFERTTRRINLTDVGEEYYRQCQQALDQLIEADRRASGQQLEPAGVIRMSLPTPYGQYRVLPLLDRFRVRYPKVEFDLQLSNRNIDFVGEGYDLAIRARTPPDSGLVARKLEDAELVVVATPDYIRTHRLPETPDELLQHNCIQFKLPSSGRSVPWPFLIDGQLDELVTNGSYSCSDELLAGVVLAKSSAGVYQTYRFIVEEELRQGQLLELLPSYGGCSRPFSILYPRKAYLPVRIRLIVDYLLAELKG